MSNTRQLDLPARPRGRTSVIMASGFVPDLTNLNVDGLPVEDIARALVFQPRWCGATADRLDRRVALNRDGEA